MSLFSSIFKLQFDNRTSTIDEHINEFETRWGWFASTVAGAIDTDQPAGAYAVLTKCDGAKAHILLGTFPDSYKMIQQHCLAVRSSQLSEYHSPTLGSHLKPRKNIQITRNTYTNSLCHGSLQLRATSMRILQEEERMVRPWPYRSRMPDEET